MTRFRRGFKHSDPFLACRAAAASFPDGRPILHNLIIRPLPSQDIRLCLIQINDVTVTVVRERILRERRDAKYRAVVDTAQDAIVTTDAGGTLQWMNIAAERIFDLQSQEALGQDIGCCCRRKIVSSGRAVMMSWPWTKRPSGQSADRSTARRHAAEPRTLAGALVERGPGFRDRNICGT